MAPNRSYSQQFADLKGTKDISVFMTAYPKPSKEAQATAPGARKVPFTGNIYYCKQDRPLLAVEPVTMTKTEADRRMKQTYMQRYFGLIVMHAVAFLVAPFYFSWRNVAIGMFTWSLMHAIGICFSYHRQLTHRSFKTPKWLEYLAAWLGSQAAQGDPIEWVSNHRYHHLHTDTPLDPHSPYEGFWWSHMGWFANQQAACERPTLDHSNVTDLTCQPFYKFLQATWFWQLIARHLITQAFFGTEAVCWTLAFPIVWGWHVTFLVNSAAHLWGYQIYETGDLSRNNWWVALLTAGEGWHNAHHAFPFSARHGLEWYEVDLTYMVVCLLQAVGLAWDVQLPSEKQKAAKRRETVETSKKATDAGAALASLVSSNKSMATKLMTRLT
eukprot:GHRR01015583.1.p1 GENE.GHRR01015583.1~~GHRR01015583.1.p1  ORF type:complete len:384 (+),score=68.88 GHRR01015583.1:424-1575(+)